MVIDVSFHNQWYKIRHGFYICVIYSIAVMTKYRCIICGYIYDPVEGDPDGGISPGTPFEDIPDSWECPVCGVSKSDFEPA